MRARANNFQVCKEYILQGLGIGAMPTQIICTKELREGTIVPILPDWLENHRRGAELEFVRIER